MISAAVLTACICHPNFEGAAVSIIDGDAEWGVSPVAAGTRLVYSLGQFPLNGTAEWHVQQTGDFPPTYIVKEVNHNDLVVDAASGELTLEKSDSSKVELHRTVPGGVEFEFEVISISAISDRKLYARTVDGRDIRVVTNFASTELGLEASEQASEVVGRYRVRPQSSPR
ncbi:hypothetical protein B0H14DRAFT_3500157 [Mycena olivaceomarginata]|nr:hypothetical protein B0H14DRAFT_3500157 [Mycena olivaceomarginata]